MPLALEIERLLTQLDDDFYPTVSTRTDIQKYAKKLATEAMVFSAYDIGEMTAFVAVYCNNMESRIAFMPMVAVAKGYRKNGLASSLIGAAIRYIESRGFRSFKLEVHRTNMKAIAMYKLLGFRTVEENGESIFMEMSIGRSPVVYG